MGTGPSKSNVGPNKNIFVETRAPGAHIILKYMCRMYLIGP